MTGPAGGDAVDGEGPRRYLIATAVSRYPKCSAWDRPGLVQAREEIVELFTEKLGYTHHTALGLDSTRLQLTDQLRAFCTSDERREDDLVVVYLSGHGEVLEDGNEHVLLMADTDPADVTYTALPTADLVRVLRGTRIRRLLLILDTCYSGQGGNELAAAALERLGAQWGQGQSSSGLVIMSSAQPHQQAQTGVFPHLLGQAVSSQATAGHAPAHLSVSAVVQHMNDHPDKPGYQHISLSMLGLTGEPPDFLTNPRHDVRLTDVDLVLQDAAEFDAYALQRETEFTSRLLVRAMGYHGDAAHGWWFCGRHQALAELAAWLNLDGDHAQGELVPRDVGAGECVRVVTAGPGSGKTAVLGLLAALTMPERRRTVPVGALGLRPDWIPGEGSIDVVMYAQNLTDTQVLSGLAAAAGFKCATVGEFLETLGQRNNGRGRPFTVLIDALDEAATPDTLCLQIVRPLIEHSRGRIRLLLGTRPYLLDRLGISSHPAHHDATVINLDSPRYADREALLAYTMRNLLQSRLTSPYRTTVPHLLRAVARAVADAADTSFLVARFAAYTLASADAVVANPHSACWRASLPRHAGQAMRDDLTRRLGPEAQRATDLLRPLAYAEGQGLPWEDVWAPLASAISGRTYTDEDLLWLRHHAGSYVVEATENGRSAYRLYHQALTEHLREDTEPAAVHAAFVDTLTRCVPYRGDATRDWSRAHPYTLNHLATHAAAAGLIDDLLGIAEYLVYASPHSLTPHLQDASTDQARLSAAVYRTSLDLHATAPAPARRTLLALNAARAGAASLLQQLDTHAHAGDWLPAWATGHDFTPALRHTLLGHSTAAVAVACTVLDGRPVAVGATDRGVYLWDLATGRSIGEPFSEFEGWVSALACTVLDGRTAAVIATGPRNFGENVGGGLYVWDLATRRLIGQPFTGFRGPVSALACTVLEGRPVTVIANRGGDERVHVRDLATGRLIGQPLVAFNDQVRGLACTVLDGRPITVIATGPDLSERGGVHAWDMATGHLSSQSLTGLKGAVSALACTVLDGRTAAVIATGNVHPMMDAGGATYVRDLVTGDPIGRPLNGPVRALACTILDGRPVTVTVGDDGTVRSWDLLEGSATTAPTTVSTDGPVDALACTVLNGRPAAVIANRGGDERVQVRDLATGRLISRPFTEFVGDVRTLACSVLDGRPVTLIATDPGLDAISDDVHVRDLATGGPLGQPFTGFSGSVSALTCAVLDGRPIGLIANDPYGGGEVHIWDLATGRAIGQPFARFNGSVSALTCTILYGRPVAVIATHPGPGPGPGDRGGVHVWDLATGGPLGQPFTGFSGFVSALTCTVLDGRPVTVIATNPRPIETESGGRIYVRGLENEHPISHQIAEFNDHVRGLACTVLDGRPVAAVATGSSDLHVWDIRSQKPVQHLAIPGLRNVEFSPDNSLVVVMDRDIAVLRRRSDKQALG
jgi:WD40 repeat protein